jgi:hypothetical protein
MEDVDYLQRKLYRALNVPLSRLETMNGFNMGRSAEITRDEVKFYKFIQRLRNRFAGLLSDVLKKQLLLKGVIAETDWQDISQTITFDYNQDSYFNELQETEMLKERIAMVAQLEPLVGKYISSEYLRKEILKQTDEDIEKIDSQNTAEKQKIEMEQAQMQAQMAALGLPPAPPPGAGGGQPPVQA